jgi:RNA recognition motif-containing protein
MLAIKMRGLPFNVKDQDIKAFFKDYNLVNGSVKIGETSEKVKTGEAAVLFNDEKECKFDDTIMMITFS